jgi:uncharacterized protein (DUF169 family)
MAMDYKDAFDQFVRYLRVESRPLSIKFLQGSAEIPQGVMRPSTFNVKMAPCQVNTIARKWNMAMAVTPEEVCCAAALLAFGWGDLGELDRRKELADFVVSAGYVKDLEKAKPILATMPYFAGEKKFPSKGLVVAPIDSGIIADPDVILIYGNPAQINRLVQSMLYSEGGVIESRASLGASCVFQMIEPLVSGKPAYVIPGRGERQVGLAQDHEMVFTLPASKLPALLEGLRETDEKGAKYPVQPFLFFEPLLNEAVSNLLKKIKLPESCLKG